MKNPQYRSRRTRKQNEERKAILIRAQKRFNELFPDETSHIRSLCLLAGSTVFNQIAEDECICPVCESKNTRLCKNGRVLKCKNCKRNTCTTANTFFQGIKKPKAWNMAIWYYREGNPINASELAMLADVTKSSALEIIRKISMVISEHLVKLDTQICTSFFKESISKRSFVTPAGKSPSEEIDEVLNTPNAKNEETQTIVRKTEPVKPSRTEELASLSKDEIEILRVLDGERTSFEQLCNLLKIPASRISSSLTILELGGFITSLFGDMYCLSEEFLSKTISANGTAEQSREIGQIKPNQPNAQSLSLANIIVDFTCEIFSGISRKYLQLYVALFWLCMYKDRWSKTNLERAFQKAAPFSRQEIKNYDSTRLVIVPA